MLFKPAVTLICDIDNVSTSSLVRAKGVGGGGTPYNGLYGDARPERGTFFRLQVYKRGIKIANKVHKRV